MNYNLEERTAQFGISIIKYAKSIPYTPVSKPLISQLVRSGTSIGAKYMEADGAVSKKDFQYKIALCRKESKETMHWLRMIAQVNPEKKKESQLLWLEGKELTLIFSSILKNKALK